MKNTATVRPGRALLRAIWLVLLRLHGRIDRELRVVVPSHGGRDLADRCADDADGHALGYLEVPRLLVHRPEDADDPRREHHLVTDGETALHPLHRLLAPLSGSQEQQPEQQG